MGVRQWTGVRDILVLNAAPLNPDYFLWDYLSPCAQAKMRSLDKTWLEIFEEQKIGASRCRIKYRKHGKDFGALARKRGEAFLKDVHGLKNGIRNKFLQNQVYGSSKHSDGSA